MEQFKYHLLDFEVFKNLDLLKSTRIVLWGAANKGRQIKKTLERMEIKIDAFCDSDLNKWGKTFDAIPIISPYKLKNLCIQNESFCIISCVFRECEVLKLLQELELNDVSFLSYWGIKTACVLYGIPLEPEDSLPSYDKIWMCQTRILTKKKKLMSYLNELYNYDPDTIWCMQPGKVASLTVNRRLQQAGFSTIHGHDFFYLSMYEEDRVRSILTEMVRLRISGGVKIVTGVREPLARDYAAFWEPFTRDLPYVMPILEKDFQEMYIKYIDLLSKGFDYARLFLKETVPFVWRDEFEWFNEEIKRCVGVDIYQYPFDKEKGYQIIKQGNIQIFIYKTEKLDSIMPMLSEFLGKDVCSTENTNRFENKNYNLAYKEFRESIKLPRRYVEHYYKNNPYMNHFYTKAEQEAYLFKWKDYIDEQI